MRLELDPEDVERIAAAVVDKLRAGDQPEYFDQHSSPLGPRKHCAAIRSGELEGLQLGRRWLARRVDVGAYVARLAEKERPRSSDAAVAESLGLRVVGGRDR